MKSAALFAAAFALSCVAFESAETSAFTKIRRYSAFSCYSTADVVTTTAPEAKAIAGPTYAYCPHVSSDDFSLSEVNEVLVGVFRPSGAGQIVPSAKACTSWTSAADGSYSYSCGSWVLSSVAANTVDEISLAGNLSSWTNHPTWYPYLIVSSYSGASASTHVAGYKVSD
ncbi:MAG TPA: hypothetical protein VL242_23490 [Sorangium sp.]|nr:hypothetical protein [Sorangium sp.]